MNADSIGSFDYVIVGAGTAGCLLANRLSEDPAVRVLLLEAGGKDDYFWIHVPVGYLYTMGNPRTDWLFRTESEPGLNGRALDYPRGKVLGGCSSINGMIYMRGQAADYDHWAQTGAKGWSWADVLPYFRRSEDHYKGETDLHGAGGEWRVERQRLSWEILDAWREAAIQAGIPATDDFNGGDNEGVGYFEVNQRGGVRWSTAKAYLRPAMSRPNLTIMTKAQATRIVLEGGRAVGLEFRRAGRPMRVDAAAELILAAGAVASPVILQQSGVGPGAVLAERGLDVRRDLRGVGENLQDHLQVRAVYKVDGVKTLNRIANSLIGKAGMGLEYALKRSGPLSMAPSQLGCFTKSDPSRETPNLQYHVQPLSTDKLGEDLHPFDAFTASVCNLRPQSRGHVRLRSADPLDKPVIRPNYLSDPADQKIAAEALKLTRRISDQPALQKYKAREYKPGLEISSDEELWRAAGDIATTIFHPVGTCKMGPASDGWAVVDERLRVHGIAGLRVIDASIMPTITSGNTNAPTLMIAEKGAAMIREDAKARAAA
ncbi:MAG: choline dehydrogenase [Marivibrio sp.]|uniref:GMC family oxidoreductase n=1 Tax=Marivibrio sp. TaxID=2039719 RepID=UPI0032EB63AF